MHHDLAEHCHFSFPFFAIQSPCAVVLYVRVFHNLSLVALARFAKCTGSPSSSGMLSSVDEFLFLMARLQTFDN